MEKKGNESDSSTKQKHEELNKGRRKSLGIREVADMSVMIHRWRSVSSERRKFTKMRVDIRHSKLRGQTGSTCCSILKEDAPEKGATNIRLFGKDMTDLTGRADLSRCLMRYFIKASNCNSDLYTNKLDIDIIVDLLHRGADLNWRDTHGQTVLHEVALNWSPEVAEQMVRSGANVRAADDFGWTPLHVAAAYDYPEMCRTLVQLGADKEARANNGQTPLFFAAKTDSTRALRALIKLGCEMEERDERQRTPLFAACELDRSETAALLLEHNCDAFVQDKTGQIAFVPLIKKMPPLAETALAQLNKTYRIERKQKLDLFRLDPRQVESTGADEGVDTKGKQEVVRVAYHSALKAIIETNNYQMIDSTVISAMLGVQWTQFGRIRAIGQIILQLINIILWTIFAVDKEWTQRHEYDFPREGYRVAVLIGAIGITAYLIIEEIMEIVRSRRRHEAWKTWKLKLIEEDLELVHPSHDDESKYLRKEVEEIKKSQISYFDDWWNYLDWACYIILLASLISHFAEVGWPGGEGNLVLARWHVRIMALNIVVLWIRLLKYVKPFEFFGPFIVMLGMILGDLAKFFLLYLEFFIPFTCIFWTILGGDKNLREADILTSKTLKNYSMHNFTRVTVENMETFYSTAFSMFRLTLVDEYQYDQMADIDPITSQIILGCWFAISAILFLNLFIAQLSETFKSVFDNAKPAAAMQKAITLLNCYESMRMSQRVKFHKYLKEECNPLKLHYDDDVTMSSSVEEQQKATLEIRDMVKKIQKRVTRLYEKEIEQSDSDENDLVVDESEARRQQRKRKTKTRQMAEKAALRMQARLEELESSTRSELLGIHRMLQDIAIVVAGLTRDDSNVSAASGPSRPPPPASNRDFSEQQQQHDDEFEGANNEGSVTFVGPRRPGQSGRSGGGGSITEVEPAAPHFQRNDFS
ncbi:hypothetical protein BOX15_Mlig022936g1 [Macrostomum lignano]|uniref:Ion transport domain-containing protein n=3 Tax=Macrostomum lignano TaxID=282301 RepID=A0A267E8Y8_9PLAT|nr:hypothetical protein BOX15_Mlig022936g1 [Macrostomum lignano]